MRVHLQRVSEARVSVDGDLIAEIGAGLLALVGTTHGDDEDAARYLAGRSARLRIFADDSGRTNLSALDVAAAVLVVPQFTLYADCRKGNRPSFTQSGDPTIARELVSIYALELEALGICTARGRFGADMRVSLCNEGPFTILLERQPR